jgi:acyl carrier protein
MSTDAVRTLVIEALRKVSGAAHKTNPVQLLADPAANPSIAQFGLDSLDAVEWCMEIETRTGVEFDPAELAGLGTLNDLVGFIEGRLGRTPTVAEEAVKIEPAPRDRPLVLSFVQEAMWWHSQVPDSALDYVLAAVDRIQGPLNPAVFCDCLNDIVRRHEILRTSYDSAGEQPFQIVHAPEPLALMMLTLPPGTDPKMASALVTRSEMPRVADLRQQPLIRFYVLRVNPNEHWLLKLCHHIMWDDTSAKILVAELSQLYPARIAGLPLPLPDTEPLQFADYAAWQRKVLYPGSTGYQDAIRWWKDLYAGLPQEQNAPFLRSSPREDVAPDDGVLLIPVEGALTARISRFVQDEGATVYAVWFAALAALLSEEIGQPDAIVGSYMTNRRRPQWQNMIGCFSNLAVLRLRPEPNQSFREWMTNVRACVAGAEAHGEVHTELVKSELASLGVAMPDVHIIFGAPLAQSRTDAHFADLTLTRPDWPLVAVMPWRVSLNLHEHDGAQTLRATFDARSYDPDAVRRFAGRLMAFVDEASREPGAPLRKLLEPSALPG